MPSIKTNQAANGIVIGSGDTTLLNPTAGRGAVTFASLHEQTGATETIELFISPDATSAAGERLDTIIFAADETLQPASMLLTVPSGFFLIGKATTGGLVESNISFTQYSGSS